MNDYDNGDLLGTAGHWGDAPLPEVAYAIDAAIQQAARSPISGLAADEGGFPGISEFLGRRDSQCAGEPGLPRDPDSLLLDILPVSATPIDDAYRLQIEPDAAAMRAWDPADRGAAEHLVSWLNACVPVREAIANAIAAGSHRWDEEASRYDAALRDAGYDRADPLVQERNHDLRNLHDAIQHAQQILDDPLR